MTLFGGNRSVSVGLDLNPKGYLAGLAAAGKATKDWARAADASIGKHRRSWDDIGNAAGKAGLVIGAGAAAAVVKFAQFDKSMSRAAAGTQATATQMDKLRTAAIQAGQDTQFSATEAADAITEMGKAGVGVQDILGGGLAGTLSLAAAGELEVADAAGIAATALSQFGLKGADLPHVADLLAAGAGKAQGSVADLGLALKYVGPVARSAGISIEETVGIIAELASQGIIGEQAGTSFRGMLQSLRGPSKEAAKTMKAFGIELYDANGSFVGMAAAAEQLHAKLGPLPQAQRDAALATLFGNEQVTAATILMNGGAAAVEKWTAAVNDQGYAARQAGQLMNNLAGDFEQLKGSLETALISSGSGANKGLRTLTQGATGAVNAFSSLPTKLQQTTVTAAGVAAGALLLTAGVIKGAIAVKAMRTNLEELGVSGTRVSGILGRVGKVAAGIGVGFAVAGVVDSVIRSGDEAQATINETTSALLKLQAAGKVNALDKLFAKTSNYGEDNVLGFTDALGRLADPGLNSRLNSLAETLSFGAISSGRGQLEDQFHRVGQSLAEMVSSGKSAEAAAIFGELAKKAQDAGYSIEDLNRFMPEYQDALVGVANASGDASGGTSEMAGAMDSAAYKAGQLATKLKDLRKAAQDANDMFLDARSAVRDYEAALDDAQGVAKDRAAAQKKISEAQADVRTAKTPDQKKRAAERLKDAQAEAAGLAKTLDPGTDAGRKNQALLDALAKGAQAKANGVLAETGSDEKYRASLEESRKALKRQAIEFGNTKGEAQAYIDIVLRIPEKPSTDVSLTGIDVASGKLKLLLDQIATINGKPVTIPIEASSANVREDRGGATAPSKASTVASLASILPARALGGPVSAGKSYLVGEKRAEVFTPKASGYVFPSVGAHAAAQAPQVVRVAVRESHTTSHPVSIGQVNVTARDPETFTDWSRTNARFGVGGVG